MGLENAFHQKCKLHYAAEIKFSKSESVKKYRGSCLDCLNSS